MSMSGAEYLRRIKEQVDEVDPSRVRELAHEGATIIDVRETEEWDSRPSARRPHVPRGYLESRIDGAVARPLRARHPLLRLRQPPAPSAAKTLTEDWATSTSSR